MDRRIEGIIICKNCADYLVVTLPLNKNHFNHLIVVTSAEDIATQTICSINNTRFIIYDGFNKNGAKFNFGGARQFGLNNLIFKDWVIILDADIIVPSDFVKTLDFNNKDIEKFYGSYRRFIPTYTDFKHLIAGRKNKEEFKAIEGSGCGFWQCFNINSKTVQKYGINNLYHDSYSAEQVDIDFLKLFCPLVEHDPNLVRTDIELWHLGNHGQNHMGRSDTDKFFDVPHYYYHLIDGWMDFENLYSDLLLNKLPENANFVEVGVWRGKSISYLAELSREFNKKINIFAVDIFAKELDKIIEPYTVKNNELNGYTLFLQNMARAGILNRVIPMVLFSEDAAQMFPDNYLDCVFLDGAHEEKNVINDLNVWYPKIKIGGYLCGHDYKDGIQPFVDKWFKEKLNTVPETYLPHCFIYKKI